LRKDAFEAASFFSRWLQRRADTADGPAVLAYNPARCLVFFNFDRRKSDIGHVNVRAMSKPEDYEKRHKDGTLWARGQTLNGEPTGYWEWFRKDGTKLRSGHFENGEQVGEWTTYDRAGEVYKVTTMKRKKPTASS
jgi:hypothetical protein